MIQQQEWRREKLNELSLQFESELMNFVAQKKHQRQLSLSS